MSGTGQRFYNLDSTEHETVNRYLSGLVSRSLMELENSYCLEIGEDNRSITPLTLGRIASYYYLKHNTVHMFSDVMKSESTIPELIDVLSNASEYAELPVRHNEDQINSELANQVPLEVNQSAMDSAHTKTNILLQAYFCRLPMPSSDYHTDTKSVLDQVIRILQAMLDVSADQGWLVTSLNVIVLIQMVVQGQWWYDSSLLQLPNIQPYHTYFFRPQGKGVRPKGFPDLKGPIETLPQLIAICDGKFEALSAMLDSELSPQQIDQAYQVLTRMPQIEIDIEIRGWLQGYSHSVSRPVNIRHKGGIRPDEDWLPVHADQEYVLSISLKRLNKTRKSDSKAHSSHFPKPKDEGWFIVVGIVDCKEVVALKRVSYIRGRTSAQIALYTPEKTGRVVYTVYLMSDAYIGLDQQFDVCVDVIESSIEAQVNSELHSDGDGDGH